ncbi:MAG TPA: 50S ribosomal protein L11 methyltransferase [Dehalococcoidia bacterium]|nr:50S ribosomal protein L11 methyltransferase [SAR202 cluster bacterium]HAC20112.1 50S ribosomal protein L11 methyltransferase [Dehalococcoidia bacterium]
MKWIELTVDVPPEYAEPMSEIFHRYGHGGVAIEQEAGYNPDEGESPPVPDFVTIKTYLPVDNTTERRRNQIDIGVRLVAHLATISPLKEKYVEEEDWQNAWKEHFHPLRIGRHLVICPTWRTVETSESDILIHLDPGMAFGTGHHPTTRTCMEILERDTKPGDRILDVGCGSGILSVVAVKVGATSALGLEIDPVAARAGEENVRINGIEDKVQIVQGTLPSPLAEARSFDIVAANISAKVVTDLAQHLIDSVAIGGKLIAGGIIEPHVEDVTKALNAVGASIDETFIDGDWVTLLASA